MNKIEREYPENYHLNRTKVFEIYGINDKSPSHDCHHIVTKNDVKTGLVGPNFHLDDLSNLYPIEKEFHVLLNKIIDAVDDNRDIRHYLDRWKEMELNLKKPEFTPEKLIEKTKVVVENPFSLQYKKLKFENQRGVKEDNTKYKERKRVQELRDQEEQVSDYSFRINLVKI